MMFFERDTARYPRKRKKKDLLTKLTSKPFFPAALVQKQLLKFVKYKTNFFLI